MKICVGSMFRNSESYLGRYATQVSELRAAAPQHEFRCILAEGDSRDRTYEILKGHFNGSVFKCEHGGPEFGSVCDPVRHRQMSLVKQAILDRVDPYYDVLVYVEADLVWRPEVIVKLIDDLALPEVDVVAPMVTYRSRFFDVWGMRGLDGEIFGYFYPYHPSLLEDPVNGLHRLSSVGSCLAMKAHVARTAKFAEPEDELAGFCRDAGRKGFKIWLDPRLSVEHP